MDTIQHAAVDLIIEPDISMRWIQSNRPVLRTESCLQTQKSFMKAYLLPAPTGEANCRERELIQDEQEMLQMNKAFKNVIIKCSSASKKQFGYLTIVTTLKNQTFGNDTDQNDEEFT